MTTFEGEEHEPGVWRDQASCDAPHRAPMKAIAAVRPVLHVLNTAQQCLMYNCAPACRCHLHCLNGATVQLWWLSEYPGSVFDSALNAFRDLICCWQQFSPAASSTIYLPTVDLPPPMLGIAQKMCSMLSALLTQVKSVSYVNVTALYVVFSPFASFKTGTLDD